MGKTLKEGGRELELKALEALQDRIAVYGDQADLLHPEWNGQSFDIMAAVLTRFGEHLDTCMGEYYFKPAAGNPDGGAYFCAVITLKSDVPAERVPELAYALSIMNFYIESGCFALNKPTDLLVFRSTRSFPGNTPEETLVRDCVLHMEEACGIAEKYCTPVLALAEGSMELPEFIELLQTE